MRAIKPKSGSLKFLRIDAGRTKPCQGQVKCSSQPAVHDSPYLLDESVPRETTRALRFPEGALRGRRQTSSSRRHTRRDRQGREDCWLESRLNGTLRLDMVTSLSRSCVAPLRASAGPKLGGAPGISTGIGIAWGDSECNRRTSSGYAEIRSPHIHTETEPFTAVACHSSRESGCIVLLNRCRAAPAAWDRE